MYTTPGGKIGMAVGGGAVASGGLAVTGFPVIAVTFVGLMAVLSGLVLLRLAVLRRHKVGAR